MGAAAFLMIEFLNLPYSTIIIAAIVPAFMHFYGVFMQVHFEAKNKGLRGLTKEELPDLPKTLKANWPTLIPLVLLIGIIVQGNTPYLAAFTGITSCILVGLFTSRQHTTALQYVALVVSHAAAAGADHAPVRRATASYVFLAMVVAVPFVHEALGRESRIGRAAILAAFETRRQVRAGGRRGGGDGRHRDRRRDADRRGLQAVVHRHVGGAVAGRRRAGACCRTAGRT